MSTITVERDDCVITLNTPEFIDDRESLQAMLSAAVSDLFGYGAKVTFDQSDFDGAGDEPDRAREDLFEPDTMQDLDEAWESPGGDIGDDDDAADDTGLFEQDTIQDADEAWESLGDDDDDF